MGVVLAIDAGTTGIRVIAVDRDGSPGASAYREIGQHYPRPGWVEHDPAEIVAVVTALLGEVARRVDEPIAAVGITDQRETVVVWDRGTGRPLHPAIVWQDRRTAGACATLRAGGSEPFVRDTTGLVLDPYFSATKLAWLFAADGGRLVPGPDVVWGTIDSWILWNLTGGAVHATDVSNASRTALYDIGRNAWSDDLRELFGVPAHGLAAPEVRPSSGSFGTTDPAAAAGLRVPISGIAGDQQAALFGQACLTPGTAKNTYGTGSFVLVNAGADRPPPVEGILTTVAWQLGDEQPVVYALEGAVFVTGGALQWLRDGLGVISDARETEALAASVPDTGGVYFVPALSGLGSPWWDPHARGAVVGLSLGTTRAHLVRAVVEAMAWQTLDVVEAMGAAGRPVIELRVDGGASVMDLLCQLQADVLGVAVARAASADSTALGAAWLAGLAAGLWDLDTLAARGSPRQQFLPGPDSAAVRGRHGEWRRALAATRGWAAP